MVLTPFVRQNEIFQMTCDLVIKKIDSVIQISIIFYVSFLTYF